uniref:Uncharacterized protein n=1 Tax=Megaselia scalaris TaxID=36166 RepID=T1GXZ0_MEGSC
MDLSIGTDTYKKQYIIVVKTTATDILGIYKPQNFSGWIDEEYDKAVAKKKRSALSENRPKKDEGYERSVSKQKKGGCEIGQPSLECWSLWEIGIMPKNSTIT